MKKIKQLIKSKTAQAVLFVIVGLLGGWLIFSSPTDKATPKHVRSETVEKQIWTCSMHPQIRKDEPGDCPICGMDLIPLRATGNSSGVELPSDAMQMSQEAIALANIQTSIVSRDNPIKEILLYGVIASDERSMQSQTAHVGGRIEELFVDFTGETVVKGQKLATIYSPELVNAQQELLEAVKLKMSQPQLLEAAREKLRLWKITNEQIADIEASGLASPIIEIKSNTSGIVTVKKVNKGDYITAGGILFEVANLSKVWAMFDAYEGDLAFLKVGDKLNFKLQAVPGKIFTGNISFIDPILDKNTRTARVRVDMQNPNMILKPEMYATATVAARLQQYNNRIVIPQSAVLWTGKRSIVYVSISGYDVPTFQLREVELGPSLGDSYVVLDGLQDGEAIVSNGAFAIDASAQLEGKRSMMNSEVGRPVMGHEGHNMSGGSSDTDAVMKEKTSIGNLNNSKMEHTILKVEGNCGMCKERIEKAALGVDGVSSATWSADDKMLHLNFYSAKTNLDAISKAIAEVGHDTEKDKADSEIYKALPGCCKYKGKLQN